MSARKTPRSSVRDYRPAYVPPRSLAERPAVAQAPAPATWVRVVIPGKPLSVNAATRSVIRAKGSRRYSRVLKTAEGEAFLARAQLAARKAMGGRPPLTGDLVLRVIAYWPRRNADSDAALKPTKDALQGIVYANDRTIVEDRSRRGHDLQRPRVEVWVWVDGHEPDAITSAWEDAHEGTGESRRTIDDPTAGRAYLDGAAP